MTDSTRPLRFDLIAFDWDGTLYDSTRLIVRSVSYTHLTLPTILRV